MILAKSSTFQVQTAQMKMLMLVISLLCCPTVFAAQLERMVGYAYDQKSKQLIYLERHQRWFDGDRLRFQSVDYEDANGVVFARKTLNYQGALQRPDFALIDDRSGHIETLSYRNGDYLVGASKGNGASWRENTISQKNFVADAGFDRMIITRWDELMRGLTIDLPFLIPVAAKTVPFRLKKLSDDSETVTFRMSARSWLVRVLVAPIDVSYSKSDKRLVQYRGLSNLHNERLKNFKVVIEFPMQQYSREMVEELAETPVPAFARLKAQASD